MQFSVQCLMMQLLLFVALFADTAWSIRCYQCSSYLSRFCDDPFELSSIVHARRCDRETNSTKYSSINVMRNMFMVLGNIFPPTYYGFELYVGLYPASNHYMPDRRRRQAGKPGKPGETGQAGQETIEGEEGKEVEEPHDDVHGQHPDHDVHVEDDLIPVPDEPEEAHGDGACFKVIVKAPQGQQRVFRGCTEPSFYDFCTMALGYSKDADQRIINCKTCNKSKCNHASSPRIHQLAVMAAVLVSAWSAH